MGFVDISQVGKVPNDSQVTGAEAANRLLAYSGMRSVSIEGARGSLSDHYDPRSHKLRLSTAVANERSVASMAVAAHEIGHASQHDRRGVRAMLTAAAFTYVAALAAALLQLLYYVSLVAGIGRRRR